MSFSITHIIGVLTAAGGFVGAVAALILALLNAETFASQVAIVLVSVALLLFAAATLVAVLKSREKPSQ